MTQPTWHFADCTLDPARRELRRAGQPVAIEPQVFDVLLHLLRHRERVVTRDDLIADVWGGRIVSESTLSSRINAARRAVGDNGEAQALIRTFSRVGVRFVGDAREVAVGGETAPSASPAQDAGAAAPAAAALDPAVGPAASRPGSLPFFLAEAAAWTARDGLDEAAERFCGLWLMFWPNLNYEGEVGGIILDLGQAPPEEGAGLEMRWRISGSELGRRGPGFATGHMLFGIGGSPLRRRTFGAQLFLGTTRRTAIMEGVILNSVGPRGDQPCAMRVLVLRLAGPEPNREEAERRFVAAGQLVETLNSEGWDAHFPEVLRPAMRPPPAHRQGLAGVHLKPDECPFLLAEHDVMVRGASPHRAALRDGLLAIRALFGHPATAG